MNLNASRPGRHLDTTLVFKVSREAMSRGGYPR